MAEKKFKIGDVVCLKSGGPDMTVQGYEAIGFGTETKNVRCAWFVGTKSHEQFFHEDSIELAG